MDATPPLTMPPPDDIGWCSLCTPGSTPPMPVVELPVADPTASPSLWNAYARFRDHRSALSMLNVVLTRHGSFLHRQLVATRNMHDAPAPTIRFAPSDRDRPPFVVRAGRLQLPRSPGATPQRRTTRPRS
ncbi:hypothetical protein PF003_g15631 [Phytophthora fragariae]|nr:hypothetical protein PF003_g15631 [Phytophthora fragariae]